MNWMDDGEKDDSTNPIKAIKVDYNISLAEAIKLSVEKSGYEAEVIKNNKRTSVNIKIPFLIEAEDDMITLDIREGVYCVFIVIGVKRPNTLEEKLAILEYINYNNVFENGFVEFSWVNTDELSLIGLSKCGRRLDEFDMLLEYGMIHTDMVNVIINLDNELLREKLALKERIKVYIKEDLEFNMSGEWNATHGFEYHSILHDINHLINVIQREKDNLLQFT